MNATRIDRGRTFADHFCGNGLMAKFADGGTSTLLQGKRLLDMILSHVGYERGQPEQAFSYHSPFLSFTRDLEAALNFSERTRKKELEECPLEDASYFVWELDIDLPDEVEPGRYQFVYKASSVNCRQHVYSQIQRAPELVANTGDGDILAVGLMNLFAMRNADADSRDHCAEIIDVVTYVQGHDTSGHDLRLVANTLERARRSREWLLCPTDPMEDGSGLSSRFVMNRHLRPRKYYRVCSAPKAR